MSDKQPYAASLSGFKMRSSRVLRKIREGKVARVLKLNTNDAKAAEIFAASQLDAIWVCQEHVSGSFETIEHQIRAAKLYDVDTIVRVARGSYSDYVRPLESDATALMVDPWGQAYRYAYKPSTAWTNSSYILASGGPDEDLTLPFPADGLIDAEYEAGTRLGKPINVDNVYANRN